MIKSKKEIIGLCIVVVGLLYDRVLYHYFYLPQIDKAFSFSISLEEILFFYKEPYTWFGLLLLFVGAVIILFPFKKKSEKDLYKY